MRSYIDEICKELEFPAEAIEAMQNAWSKLEGSGESKVYCAMIEEYRFNKTRNLADAIKEIDLTAEKAGIHRYTAELLFFLLLTQPLREHYEKQGIPLRIWHDSCMDLHWKLMECKKVYGIWGSFVAWWFPGFFDLTRFALGRLQFELIDFPKEYEAAGLVRPQEMTKAINVHIPSCGKLVREDYLKSYQMAAGFFADAFPGNQVAFVCESWLLFEGHREMLPSDSGIIQFMNDYEILLQKDSEEDLWRIFDRVWDKDAHALPERTSLQRNYKTWLLEGKATGFGYGIFFQKKPMQTD